MVIIEHNSDSERFDVRIEDSFIGSPRRDSYVESNLEETRDTDFNVNIYDMDTNINWNDQQNINIPEKETVKPSGVSNTESGPKEV